ncbi:UvrD-helicase domain-containing protein [Pseudoduganella sp. HUAS MS19]
MIKVQIAGAGAGKTFGLATVIKSRIEESRGGKSVYALTYTNAAKRKIHTEVVRQCGAVPQNLHIETVHSFLLNAIIFPFSSFVTKQKYLAASIEGLPDDVKWKNLRISTLKKANIVHAEVVYKVAKAILNRDSTNNKSKAQKAKVDHVLAIIEACTDSIFVDEVQDLDTDALEVFKILGAQDCLVHLLGDPKQAIKYPKAFEEFVSNIIDHPGVQVLDINNITRRIPQSILLHSNRFCYPNQAQETISSKVGSISYIESTDQDFHPFLTGHMQSGSIVCIDKRTGPYGTHTEEKYSFPFEVAKLIGAARPDRDPDLQIKAAFTEFLLHVKKNGRNAVSIFLKEYAITVEKQDYAKLMALSEKLAHKSSSYSIRSIDAVKGLEAETCIFVLSKTSLDYFLQEDLAAEKRFNKEWKRVYVALTRSQDSLHLVLDHSILAKEDIDRAKRAFLKYRIDKHVCTLLS